MSDCEEITDDTFNVIKKRYEDSMSGGDETTPEQAEQEWNKFKNCIDKKLMEMNGSSSSLTNNIKSKEERRKYWKQRFDKESKELKNKISENRTGKVLKEEQFRENNKNILMIMYFILGIIFMIYFMIRKVIKGGSPEGGASIINTKMIALLSFILGNIMVIGMMKLANTDVNVYTVQKMSGI